VHFTNCHHHHHQFSVHRQISGIHILHVTAFSSLLFSILACDSSFRSSTIPILGLRLGFLIYILSTSIYFNNKQTVEYVHYKYNTNLLFATWAESNNSIAYKTTINSANITCRIVKLHHIKTSSSKLLFYQWGSYTLREFYVPSMMFQRLQLPYHFIIKLFFYKIGLFRFKVCNLS